MSEITQEELDNIARTTTMVLKADVLEVAELHFSEAINRLKTRPSYDQTIMGNFITTLEIELLKDLKKLKTFK